MLVQHQMMAKGLALAGTIPFMVLTLLCVSGAQVDWLSVNPATALLVYGAVIVSFIGGIHWGFAMHLPNASHLLIHSNVATLSAWFASLQIVAWSAVLLIACFIYLLVLDAQLVRQDQLPAWFWRLRLQASSIVLLSLLTFQLAR